MADIRAFRGIRYDLGRVGTLSDVVAPPYDVIDADLQQRLYERSPYNVVRLELNREEPGDNEQENRYSRAARLLRDWQQEGVLVQDSARALYVYHQEFEVDGRRYLRKGFMARLRLEPFGQGRVFAHEETMPGPKQDRLSLLRATGMNLSQIFGLYPDEHSEVQAILDRAVARALPLEATDHLGVVSRLWPVTDQQTISAVTGLLANQPVFIADGHHRYETACRYRDELAAAGEGLDPEAPANFVLMMLVSMSDPGLIILPTHRLVSGIPDLRADDLRDLLAQDFQMETVGQGETAAREAWELIQADGSQSLLAFGTAADGVWQLGRFTAPEKMAKLAADHSHAWRNLAVSVLHVLVLNHLLRGGVGTEPTCRYVHRVDEVTTALSVTESARDRTQLAVLVPPARMSDVEQIAGNLEKMPPKSTYFYPKLLTGLVLNSVRAN